MCVLPDPVRRYGEIRGAILGIIGDSYDTEYLLDNKRTYPYPLWRMIAAYVMRNEGYMLNDIATALHRNHSTLSIGISRINEAIDGNLKVDSDICNMYHELRSMLYDDSVSNDMTVVTARVRDVKDILERNGVDSDTAESVIENIKNL